MGEGAVPEALSLSAATTSLSDNASKPAQSSAAAASTRCGTFFVTVGPALFEAVFP